MITKKAVYNGLFSKKTELESQKIELGLIDDLNKRSKDLLKAVQKSDSSWKEYQNYLTNADKPFKKMIDNYDELDGAFAFADGISKRFIKAGQELGIDVKSNKDYQNIQANLNTATEILNTISSFKDPSSFQ